MDLPYIKQYVLDFNKINIENDPSILSDYRSPVANFSKGVIQNLAKARLNFNGGLAKPGLTSLVKQATASQGEQGKFEGFDSCDRPSNLAQIGSKCNFWVSVTLKFAGWPRKKWGTSSLSL